MDDEIEDIVGDVKYTDSQKSITTRSSWMYSPDFTDYSSQGSYKNQSSGKETYVIECDSEDSEETIQDTNESSNTNGTVTSSSPQLSVLCGSNQIITQCASTSYHTMALVAQETFTQTSKTIIELAAAEPPMKKVGDSNTLETQTSFVSITENRTVEYRIAVTSAHDQYTSRELVTSDSHLNTQQKSAVYNVSCNKTVHDSSDDGPSKFLKSETEYELANSADDKSKSEGSTSDGEIVRIINDDDDTNDISDTEENYSPGENSTEFEESTETDIEEDSLMEESPKNKDVQALRSKVFENADNVCMGDRFEDPDIRRFGILTPLTEESKKGSLLDIPPDTGNLANGNTVNDDLLFTSNTGLKVKLFKDDETEKNSFKLPPIQNQSCPNSPYLNSLFAKPKLSKAGTLPSLLERHGIQDRWEIGSKNLASGESLDISGSIGIESPRKPIQLPPINIESMANRAELQSGMTSPTADDATSDSHEPICIKEKIKELKMSTKRRWPNRFNNRSRAGSRACSPVSSESPDGCRSRDGWDIADRGCEAICLELMRRLRSSSWLEVVETLDDVPRGLEKFWGIITETRIADLLRLVAVHVESPRPQVARTACATLAAILENTNYTKKPDFYETMTTLLSKTGSYSRVVRRSANLALDHVVCGVDLTHAVTALCLHGVGHKNALVRCAAARLLVVCCALAAGGRSLLRARPATAASARRHTLRALAALLDDKSCDVRKYAERLYSILRPLTNFEAYYLTDVEVELASQQMKKYDLMLLAGPPKEVR